MDLFHIDTIKHQSNSDRSMDSVCSTLINPLSDCQGAAKLPCKENKPQAEEDPIADYALMSWCSLTKFDNCGHH